MKTVLLRAQEFVPGFYLMTGNHIPSEETEELYYVRIPFYTLYSCLIITVDPTHLDREEGDQKHKIREVQFHQERFYPAYDLLLDLR